MYVCMRACAVCVCVYVTLTICDCLSIVHVLDTRLGEWPRVRQKSLQIHRKSRVHEVPRAQQHLAEGHIESERVGE